jgi:PKD repeat protein
MIRFLTALFIIVPFFSFGQNKNTADQEQLLKLYQQFRSIEIQDSIKAIALQNSGKAQILEIDDNGAIMGLVGFHPNGFPIFYSTDNTNAAATVGTNLVVAGATNGYGLTGNGMIIGEWDGGSVLGTHQELTGRVVQIDNPSSNSDHATHVCGTMIAAGITNNAKGMATAATVHAHSFSNDASEMTTFATNGILSNHSYGTITGWREMNSGTWRWYGDTTISGTEDYRFGFYSVRAQLWDQIANAAPGYLIIKSAGNDRNDLPPSSVTSHELFDNANGWVTSTVSRPSDGGLDGFDCISTNGNAKNILTVGAVSDISNGYSQPSDVSMSSFSGWGPTDDGRIKPDIVANGVSLYSTGADNNTDYYTSSGTSMSAPNATGSIALLQEMYNDSHSIFMKASTLKALVIHTANEAGTNAGPDFSFGWGLLNIKGAADLIGDTLSNRIIETSISNNSTTTFTYYSNGAQDIQATIVWNDPAATPVLPSLDPTASMLVNDLDLRITGPSGTVKMPWVLNSAMPSSAATKADNVKDNVEKVIFDSPSAGAYTFSISHKGTLSASQNFSIIISGIQLAPTSPAPTSAFTGTPTTICIGDTVFFSDSSTGNPTSLEWTFTGGSPSSSTNANPAIAYNTPGTYSVKLKATNANGSDSITQTNYVTVTPIPNPTTTPFNSICVSGNSLTITGGSPTGGIWSGVGVTNGIFNPSIAGLGNHTLTYTVTSGSCVGTSTQNITVTNPPTVTLLALPASICNTSASFTLGGGQPAGGTYSGTGVSNNVFDPSIAGMGTHVITYIYTDPSGCNGSATSSINVITGSAASLGSFSDVCIDAPTFALTGGAPIFGNYTGPGVDTLAGTFNPTLAGPGMHTITYFGPGGLCVSAANSTITVNPLPSVSIGAMNDACLSSNSVSLTSGTPTGGIYSGNSVTGSTFDASIAGLGTHTIYYTYTDNNSCTAIDSNQINVVNSVLYTVNDTTTCSGDNAFIISSGIPSGGFYSGTGISTGNTFDPTIAGIGSHTITYNDVNNPCAVPGTATFTVNATPNVTLSSTAPICLTGGPVTLTGGAPTGGTYTGPGINNNILDPTVNGIGNINITYTVSSNGCSGAVSQISIINDGSPQIINLATQYCLNDSSIIMTGDPIGGIFSGTSGVTDSIFNPNAAGIGAHTITYNTLGGCTGSISYNVNVFANPIIGNIVGPLISSQNTIAAYQLIAQNGAFYSWSVIGGIINTNFNNQITIDWGTAPTGFVQSILIDQNGCKDTSNISVDLWPLGINTNSSDHKISFYPNPVTDIISFYGDIDSSENIKLIIMSTNGQIIKEENYNKSGQTLSHDMNISNLSSGTYIFRIVNKTSELASGQFIKQ